MMLSRSKPVRRARSKREGGSQYSGTNKGSVRPRSAVQTLTRSISFLLTRRPDNELWTPNQTAKSSKIQTSHAYCPVRPRTLATLHRPVIQPGEEPGDDVRVDDRLRQAPDKAGRGHCHVRKTSPRSPDALSNPR